MPWLLKPTSFFALRFATTSRRWPCICSSVKCGRSPDAIWRGSSSPHEISSQNSLSASSWYHTLVIWPTLNSSCVQTGAAASEAGSGAGGGFAFFSGLGFFGAARSASCAGASGGGAGTPPPTNASSSSIHASR